MSAPLIALACAVTAFVAWATTWLVLRALIQLDIVDQPNYRSSHSRARPRGGGLALLPVILSAWLLGAVWLTPPPGLFAVAFGAALLVLISWFDDLRGVSARLRLNIQVVAVLIALAAMGNLPGLETAAPFFQGLLPGWLDGLLAAVAWLWFINLFNFMDGIDGITGTESICLGIGLAAVGVLADRPAAGVVLPLLLAAACAGFLVWNWQPARIFLGDVGSVPLGYLLGWLLLLTAREGLWAVAIILPLYYLADASITLAGRIRRGENLAEGHRRHFYQRATVPSGEARTGGGMDHASVVRRIALCNLVLIALALCTVLWPGIWGSAAILLGAAAAVGALLLTLTLAGGKA